MHVGILPQVPNKRNICKIPKSKKLEEHWDSMVTQLFDNKWLHYGTKCLPKMPHKWLHVVKLPMLVFIVAFCIFLFLFSRVSHMITIRHHPSLNNTNIINILNFYFGGGGGEGIGGEIK
jgi:hypothetical protein